jgi:mRNA deadenylase 3'-5' endonuclease subunit Ccr4
MSYNILAPSLLFSSVRLPEEILEFNEIYQWPYRSKLIIEIILKLQIDIICFQELEEEDNEDFLNKLKENNFDYRFKKRPKQNKIELKEGCGIFYNINKFELIESFELEYKCKDSFIVNKENVAIFILLKNKIEYKNVKNNDLLLIVCSHLLFNDKRGDIKLGQIYELQKSISAIKIKYKQFNIRIIFCCDLNSTEISNIYEYLTNNFLNCEFVDIRILSGQKYSKFKSNEFNYEYYMNNKKINLTLDYSNFENNQNWFNEIINVYPIIKQNEDKLNKNTKIELIKNEYYDESENLILKNENVLISCYKEIIGNEPEITFYTDGYRGTVDYIFHSINNLKAKQILKIPSISDLENKEINLIPNENNPSDHFPIVSNIEFI